jgi:hypothetical protein
MKKYKTIPQIFYYIGQIVVVKPWKCRGQIIGIHINHNNHVYYDIESVEAQGVITYRRGNFTKGQLEEKVEENS